ncbi:MAG TPA: hypothetical protein VF021_00785 [Longimicrobiales bacterium]
MHIRLMAAGACAALLTACHELPEAPVASTTTSYELPATVQNPASAFRAPLITSGPRVEVYSKGVLQQVFSAQAAASASADVSPQISPAGLDEVASQLRRHPLNQRTAHFADLLQAISRAPAANRSQALAAVSRQLLRETEHSDTTLADGTRILEYYFDHQLATRVVLAARGPSAQRPGDNASGSIATPLGAATEVPGETCTEGCEPTAEYPTNYLPATDAELWATLTWYADQAQAMVDLSSVEGDVNGVYMVVYAKTCVGAIGGWIAAVGGLGFGIGKLADSWYTLSIIARQGGVLSAGTAFGGVVGAWINMHNCFHS